MPGRGPLCGASSHFPFQRLQRQNDLYRHVQCLLTHLQIPALRSCGMLNILGISSTIMKTVKKERTRTHTEEVLWRSSKRNYQIKTHISNTWLHLFLSQTRPIIITISPFTHAYLGGMPTKKQAARQTGWTWAHPLRGCTTHVELERYTLPKTNSSPLKIGAPWKRKLLLETTIFRGHVSFREGSWWL